MTPKSNPGRDTFVDVKVTNSMIYQRVLTIEKKLDDFNKQQDLHEQKDKLTFRYMYGAIILLFSIIAILVTIKILP